LEGLQGAILRVKLRCLEEWTEARREHAKLYNQLLEGSGLITPKEVPNTRHVYHVYAVRTPDRSKLQSALHEQGIQTNIHYPFPVHLLEAHADLGYHAGDFPVSEHLAAEELSLPMFAELTNEQINTVCTAVRNNVRP
jgi:dTDP-4-amino-4,6-dideoxygalactose transaminase